MTAEALVQQIINNADSASDKALDRAISYADAAQTAAAGSLAFDPIPTVTCPEIDLPPFEPDTDLAGEFTKEFDKALADYGPDFANELKTYVDTYFPELDSCLKSSVDTWICNMINNGGTGLPQNVEDAVWQRGRDRILAEQNRAVADIYTKFANRGFTMPSGFMSNLEQEVTRGYQNKLAEYNRDITIRQAEIMIETTKFAVQQGNAARIAFLRALIDYINSWISMNQLPIERAKALVDAKARLWNTTATYYNALVGVANVKLKCQELSIDARLREDEIVGRYSGESVKARVDAAVSSAEALANTAASALGAQNSLANVSNVTTQTG